jgi:hypothetical protein
MIYKRTPAGDQVVTNRDVLPRKMRLLLASINGTVPSEVYVDRLTNFGDVQESLEMLEQLGYIEPIKSSRVSAQQTTAQLRELPTIAQRLASEPPLTPDARLQLQHCVTLMSDFMTQHLPDQALEMLLIFESFESTDEIKAKLKSYAALVTPLGEPASAHLKALSHILDI